MLVALDEQTAHDVLDAGTYITRYADNAKSSTRCILRCNIYRHQTTEEAKQHADAQTEQYHRRSINPEMMARNQQEQTERQRIQQAEDNGWQITVALEILSDTSPDDTVPTIPRIELIEMMKLASIVVYPFSFSR